MWKINFDVQNGVIEAEQVVRTDEELIKLAVPHLVVNEVFDINSELICRSVLRLQRNEILIDYGLIFVGFKNNEKISCCVGLVDIGDEVRLQDIYPTINGFHCDFEQWMQYIQDEPDYREVEHENSMRIDLKRRKINGSDLNQR